MLNVFGEMNENTMVVYYSADLDNIPPFMCSPFDEGWFWSNNTKDLAKYVFEDIVATYLINGLMVYNELEINEDDITFVNALKLCREYYKDDALKMQVLDKLNNLYYENSLSYVQMSKLFIEIERVCEYLGINIRLETYYTPYDVRHSKNLLSDKFDLDDLIKNFC